jgi:hypothetical protein
MEKKRLTVALLDGRLKYVEWIEAAGDSTNDYGVGRELDR